MISTVLLIRYHSLSIRRAFPDYITCAIIHTPRDASEKASCSFSVYIRKYWRSFRTSISSGVPTLIRVGRPLIPTLKSRLHCVRFKQRSYIPVASPHATASPPLSHAYHTCHPTQIVQKFFLIAQGAHLLGSRIHRLPCATHNTKVPRADTATKRPNFYGISGLH